MISSGTLPWKSWWLQWGTRRTFPPRYQRNGATLSGTMGWTHDSRFLLAVEEGCCRWKQKKKEESTPLDVWR